MEFLMPVDLDLSKKVHRAPILGVIGQGGKITPANPAIDLRSDFLNNPPFVPSLDDTIPLPDLDDLDEPAAPKAATPKTKKSPAPKPLPKPAPEPAPVAASKPLTWQEYLDMVKTINGSQS